MAQPDPKDTLNRLFEAERAARARHRDLVVLPKDKLLPMLESAIAEARAQKDRGEQALRLVRIAAVLADLEGQPVANMLVDLLGSEEAEARAAAGEALQAHAYDRFKEVALAIEHALETLPRGHYALAELPYLIAEVPEPGVTKLLGLFLKHGDPEAVAGALEAVVEAGDTALVPAIEALVDDKRRVQVEDEAGEEGQVTIGELAEEALELLSGLGGDSDDE